MTDNQNEENPENGIVSQFPNPPAFYRLYQNPVSSNKAVCKALKSISQNDSPPLSSPNDLLKPEHRYFHRSSQNPSKIRVAPPPPPPPPTSQEKYTMFGEVYFQDLALPSLKDEQIEQLFDEQNVDHVAELKRLNKLVLQKYLQILAKLTGGAQLELEAVQSQIKEIETIFKNMHHLINTYRPHQARETLIWQMQAQKEMRLKLAEEIQRTLDDLKTPLSQAAEILRSSASPSLAASSSVFLQSVPSNNTTQYSLTSPSVAHQLSSTMPSTAAPPLLHDSFIREKLLLQLQAISFE